MAFPAISYLPNLSESGNSGALAVNAALRLAESNPWLKGAELLRKTLGAYGRAKESDLEANAIADFLNGKQVKEIDPRLVGSDAFQKAYKEKDAADRGWKSLGLTEQMNNAQIAEIRDRLQNAQNQRQAALANDVMQTYQTQGIDAAALRYQDLLKQAQETGDYALMESLLKTGAMFSQAGKDLSIYAGADSAATGVPDSNEGWQRMRDTAIQAASNAAADLNQLQSDALRFDNSGDSFETVRDNGIKTLGVEKEQAIKFGESLGEAARKIKADLWKERGINVSLGHAAKLALQAPNHRSFVSKWFTNWGNQFDFDTEPVLNMYNDFDKEGYQTQVIDGKIIRGKHFTDIMAGHGALTKKLQIAQQTAQAISEALPQKQAEWENRAAKARHIMQSDPVRGRMMLARIQAEINDFMGGRLVRDKIASQIADRQ